MLAGGMTIAAPSMMVPEAAATGSLFVSAENAMFDNKFGGAQVVEVVVLGDDAGSGDLKFASEPTVRVDEHQLRLAQAVDGNWYGYFGDKTAIPAADETDNNLDFGMDLDLSQITIASMGATNVYINATHGVITNPPTLTNWNNTVNEQSTGNQAAATYSIGLLDVQDKYDDLDGVQKEWPFIQLYDFTVGTFDVVYEKAGPNEVISLDYDSSGMDDVAGMTLDRNAAGQGSQIHLTITDNQLNIDPTAEDIVIFYTETGLEGVSFTNATTDSRTSDPTGGINYHSNQYKAFSNSFDDNGKLIINNNTNSAAVAVLNATVSLDDVHTDQYMIFWESAENSGVFGNTDDDSNSNLKVNDYAKRGTTATFDYNDSAQSFLVANDFATIDMDASSVGDEWNSGEALTVTLLDQDLNLNTNNDEDLYLVNTTNTALVPSLQIGSPLSVLVAAANVTDVTQFSKIAYYTETATDVMVGNTLNITMATGYTGADLNSMNSSNTYFNFDFSSFTNSTNPVVAVCLHAEGIGTAHLCVKLVPTRE
jgi:hypothetical protein